MTSKLVVNTIEADTGISSVSFASSISMSSTSKFHFGNAGIDIGADTNINRPATGVIGFNINSGEKVRINSNGFIGINTSSPLAPLHTYNDTSNTIARLESGDATCRLQLKDSAGEGYVIASGDNLILANTSSITERLRITSDGKVGIGTETIASNVKLDVVDGIIRSVGTGSHDSRIEFLRPNTGALGWIGIPNWDPDGLYIYAPTASSNEIAAAYHTGQWYFHTGGNATHRLIISSNGDVRFGAGNPTTFGSGTLVHETYHASSYVANLVTSGSTVLQMIASQTHGASSIGTRSNHNLYLTTNDQQRVMINTDGDLKVGTTGNSGAKIQIGNHTFAGSNFAYNNNRVGFQNNGSLTCISNCSTYNDGTYPGYGLVLVQGPTTSSYNVWGICPDGPAKGNSLNLHYGAQATNIHEPNKSQFEFTGNGYFLKPNHPVFSGVYVGSQSANFGTSEFTMNFNTVMTNQGSHYNTSNGVYTCPVAGKYWISAQAHLQGQTGGAYTTIRLQKNSVTQSNAWKADGSGGTLFAHAIVSCGANDILRVRIQTNDSTQYTAERYWVASIYLMA